MIADEFQQTNFPVLLTRSVFGLNNSIGIR